MHLFDLTSTYKCEYIKLIALNLYIHILIIKKVFSIYNRFTISLIIIIDIMIYYHLRINIIRLYFQIATIRIPIMLVKIKCIKFIKILFKANWISLIFYKNKYNYDFI